MTQDLINKILVEKGEGGCWHEGDTQVCLKCKERIYGFPNSAGLRVGNINPDFSSWGNFGRLLGIAKKFTIYVSVNLYSIGIVGPVGSSPTHLDFGYKDTDEIPVILTREIAKILEEKK